MCVSYASIRCISTLGSVSISSFLDPESSSSVRAGLPDSDATGATSVTVHADLEEFRAERWPSRDLSNFQATSQSFHIFHCFFGRKTRLFRTFEGLSSLSTVSSLAVSRLGGSSPFSSFLSAWNVDDVVHEGIVSRESL